MWVTSRASTDRVCMCLLEHSDCAWVCAHVCMCVYVCVLDHSVCEPQPYPADHLTLPPS